MKTIQKFGHLTSKEELDLTHGSTKKVDWICDCGRTTSVSYGTVFRGNTRTCGHCKDILASELATRYFGDLRMEFPEDISPGSCKPVSWLCRCGRKKVIPFALVMRGDNVTCRHCNDISQEEMSTRKFGSLRMKFPREISPGSNKRDVWLCDCGKESDARIVWVTSGNTKSCGRCNLVSVEELLALQPFEQLSMETPAPIVKNSKKKVWWSCQCENSGRILASVANVFSGHIKNCGKCHKITKPAQEETPVDRLSKPTKTSFETSRVEEPVEVLEISPDQTRREICAYVRSLGVEAELEYRVGNFIYDVFVPSSNLLIEYKGLKWHSLPDSKRRDIQKYEVAIAHKYQFISIFEDEWLFGRLKVEKLLKNRLGLNTPRPIRPQKCEIRLIQTHQADAFYEENHYIGKVRSAVNFGVFYQDELVACTSFKHPTRQSSHDWELVRMASHPEYRVHGIWSKILQRFIRDYHPRSIVSFSDNRLFSGNVYEKLGFRHDGDVNSDYYWYRGNNRHHKSGLRKRGAERTCGLTEYQLREAQGYLRVWDLGKKRWVYQPESSSQSINPPPESLYLPATSQPITFDTSEMIDGEY